MFSTKILILEVCLYMIAVSTAKPTDTDREIRVKQVSPQELQDLLKEVSATHENEKSEEFVPDADETHPPIDWSVFSTRPTFDPELFNLPENYTGVDFKFEVDDTHSGWRTYRYILIGIFILKIVCYVSYRACYSKESDVIVRQTSVLVLVPEAEENDTNEQQSEASSNQLAPTDPAEKPPSYDDSVVINPLPTYDEIMRKKQNETK